MPTSNVIEIVRYVGERVVLKLECGHHHVRHIKEMPRSGELPKTATCYTCAK